MTVRLYTPLPARFSDIAEVVHVFFPGADVVPAKADEADLTHTHLETDGWAEDVFTYAGDSFRWTIPLTGDGWERKRRLKRGMKQSCYYLLRQKTGIAPPWGSLTGIRPTRLFYECLRRGDKPEEARESMVRLYNLREDRAQLLQETVLTQRGLIDAPQSAVDIYIGIPFCPTRCAYCSFFTEAVGKGKKLGPYMEALLYELEATSDIMREAGLSPRALYVGGGTPTTLEAGALERLLGEILRLFPGYREWTVEAGRPDTIDRDKLAVMRQAGVTRISVNPQTMNARTLKAIGRSHTATDTKNAFYLARKMGFDHINMDIIAGLPGEDTERFARTLDMVATLAPDSLTVHTLARKHGSVYNEFGFEPVTGAVAEAMVEMGTAYARRMGMRPYYLYRQKYVAGNLENVAYALPGKECVYNIDIMEETTSILAVGAGAISKRVFQNGPRIEHAPNVGDVGHYLTRVEEMVERKRRLWGG